MMSDISQLFFEMEYRTAQAQVGAVLLANSFTAKGATKPRSRLFRTFANRTPFPFCHFRFPDVHSQSIAQTENRESSSQKGLDKFKNWFYYYASFHSVCLEIRSRNIFASCHFGVRTTQHAFFCVKIVKNNEKTMLSTLQFYNYYFQVFILIS